MFANGLYNVLERDKMYILFRVKTKVTKTGWISDRKFNRYERYTLLAYVIFVQLISQNSVDFPNNIQIQIHSLI